ncbi:MAG TPA: GNAT family acetyltransferase [Arenicellales bacterium]|jgi:hypothetical protein|nr:GNAT family acetyltransferase [Acidiferrobacteraceae bacterium]MDP6135100.1 GNAT family acetyltransferase [Arenicellales bacterium]MDP7218208.1 GNAT family acetyltransferase [Arenicellales bacterium]HCF74039.1 GNAT family acetyltransferase [Gammaproteobacteria bacterium]HJP08490.1 GNAT family acetyltransferase [Arenicellales bacterium]|tara:strand:+ start:5824 stop:6234 length:411 start_codon:yes stop_codon:yes gene_type:complete
MRIRPYQDDDRDEVTSLWRQTFPGEPHNEPNAVIDAKLAVDRLLFVARDQGKIIGTAMAGYDGHRGWLYSVAVDPDRQRQGIGRQLVDYAVDVLKTKGCVKINLQVRATNAGVVAFYEALGFVVEDRISMGKLLTH